MDQHILLKTLSLVMALNLDIHKILDIHNNLLIPVLNNPVIPINLEEIKKYLNLLMNTD